MGKLVTKKSDNPRSARHQEEDEEEKKKSGMVEGVMVESEGRIF